MKVQSPVSTSTAFQAKHLSDEKSLHILLPCLKVTFWKVKTTLKLMPLIWRLIGQTELNVHVVLSNYLQVKKNSSFTFINKSAWLKSQAEHSLLNKSLNQIQNSLIFKLTLLTVEVGLLHVKEGLFWKSAILNSAWLQWQNLVTDHLHITTTLIQGLPYFTSTVGEKIPRYVSPA